MMTAMSKKLQVQVNGEAVDLAPTASVTTLLEQVRLGGSPCAVEVNEVVVPRRDHDAHLLHDGDRIEIVTLVGGG